MTKLRFHPLRRVRGACLILLGISILACDEADDSPQDAAPEPVPVVTTPVATTTLVRRLSYIGDIEGEAEIRVFSPIPDRIISLPVKEGDRVKRGQILSVIKSKTLSLGLQQAASGLDAARAQRDALEDQVSRLSQLTRTGAVTSSQLLNAESQLTAAQAQVRQLEATLGQARQRRGDAVIRAPITGIIGQVFVKVGDLAVMQFPICTVINMDKVRIKVRVPETDLPRLRPGQTAHVTVAVTDGPPIRTAISRVGPVLDRISRTSVMEIDLDNPNHMLKPGMLARIQVEVERRENAVSVPKDALTVTANQKGDDNFYRAVIIEQGKAVEREVLLGLSDGAMVEIRQGLTAGELLVTEGQHLLTQGDPVRTVAPPQTTVDSGGDPPAAPSPSAPDSTPRGG